MCPNKKPITGVPVSKKTHAKKVVAILESLYPDADCTLHYRQPWRLLIAGILAAQCTDARVNIVCESLFEEFQTPMAIATAPIPILEDRIRSCGFFHTKARFLKGSMQKIINDFHGEVPDTMEGLIQLPGVGRKIANLVMGDCFGKQAVVVDTHCSRIAKHIGLTNSTNPVKIEKDLMDCLPPASWTGFGHRIVAHGRAVCTARNPQCGRCELQPVCKKGLEEC